MKTIEIDDELYQFIASQTQHIGESASSILRRILHIENNLEPLVINTVSDSVHSRVEDTPIQQLISSDIFINENKNVNRFLLLLSTLYNWNSARFSLAAASLHGSKRRYLARDETVLTESGNNTKPKLIPDSPYWVVTNNNTARKVVIVETIMKNMEISPVIIDEVCQSFHHKAGVHNE